jgi:SWI/SNF chromatin-remodeling complex subunit SWI1
MINQFKNPTFGGFKPDAMQRIAGTLGYSGDMSGFQQYLANNPDKQAQMDQFKQAAMMMARGGAVQKFQVGGFPQVNNTLQQAQQYQQQSAQTQQQADQMQQQAAQTANQAAQMQQQAAQTAQQAQQYTTQKTPTGFQVLDQSGKVVKTNLDDYQQAQDYAQQQNGTLQQEPFVPTQDGKQGYVDPMGNFIPFSDMTGRPVTTMPIPDLGGYDPSQGMPEPLGEDVINKYTENVPSHIASGLKDMFKSGKLPADPNDYTISGGSRNWTITYGDGTVIKNTARRRSSV